MHSVPAARGEGGLVRFGSEQAAGTKRKGVAVDSLADPSFLTWMEAALAGATGLFTVHAKSAEPSVAGTRTSAHAAVAPKDVAAGPVPAHRQATGRAAWFVAPRHLPSGDQSKTGDSASAGGMSADGPGMQVFADRHAATASAHAAHPLPAADAGADLGRSAAEALGQPGHPVAELAPHTATGRSGSDTGRNGYGFAMAWQPSTWTPWPERELPVQTGNREEGVDANPGPSVPIRLHGEAELQINRPAMFTHVNLGGRPASDSASVQEHAGLSSAAENRRPEATPAWAPAGHPVVAGSIVAGSAATGGSEPPERLADTRAVERQAGERGGLCTSAPSTDAKGEMANPVDVSWWLAAASGTGMTTAGAAVQTVHDTQASATLGQPQAGDHAARTGAGPPPAFVHTVASAARDAALGQTSLRLEVRPQGLGDLTIDVKRGEGGVFVHVQAEHPQVQAALQAAAGEIVQAIVQQGVQVAQFQVGPLVNADGHGNPHPRSQPPPGRLGGRDEARTAREDATRVRSGQNVAIAWLGQALDRRV